MDTESHGSATSLGRSAETLAADPSTEPTHSPASDAREEQPVRVGRYLVLERLGHGGMGVVYAAYDPELDRKVAVKLVRWRRGEADAEARLLGEAQAMAKLAHPNVVPIHDAGRHEDRVFIAMAFASGGTLAQWQVKKPRTWQETLTMYRGAARGLAAAHDAGLVHRDFKPENVLIDGEGRAQVVDFGLARISGASPEAAERERVLETTGGSVLSHASESTAGAGTPAYMAPEQFQRRLPDARADQFAFCVALWEALYGRRPFRGRTSAESFAAMVEGAPEVVPGRKVPRFLEDALRRGLRFEAGDRHPDMRALLAALDPAKAIRRGRVLAGVLALVCIGGVLSAMEFSSQRACARARAEIDAVWSEARRDRLRLAFDASGVPGAADSWVRVAARVDAFVEQWKGLRAETCGFGPSSWQGSRDDRHLRELCLVRARTEIDAFLVEIEDPDPVEVRQSIEAIETLRTIDACGDVERLRRAAVWPEDPELAERATEVLVAIGRAQTLLHLGKLEDASTAAQAVLVDARALGHVPLVVQATLLEGRVLGHQERLDQSIERLREAYFSGLRHHVDEQALGAALSLIHAVGVRGGKPDEGRLWADHAEVLGERLGISERDRAMLLANRAGIAFTIGDMAEAERMIREAIEIAEAGNLDVARTSYLANLGAVLRRRGRVEEAHEVQRIALADSVALFGPDNPSLLGDHQNLGNTLSDLGRFDEARDQLERAHELARMHHPEGHPKIADARINLGTLATRRGEYAEAIAHFEAALSIYQERLGPEHPTTMRARHNLAATLLDVGDAEAVIPELEAVLVLRRRLLTPDAAEIVMSLTTLANAHRRAGDLDRAVTSAREAVEMVARREPGDHKEAAWPRRELARAFDLSGDTPAADEALAAAARAAGDDEGQRIEHALTDAEIAMRRGQHDRAVLSARKALDAIVLRLGAHEGRVTAVRVVLARALAAAGQDAQARELAEQARADLGPATRTKQLEEDLARLLD